MPDATMQPARQFLLFPVGSSGDVHPFIAIALELQRRGHDVTLFVNEHFRSLVERCGLRYAELGTDAQFRESIAHPDLWKPGIRSFKLVMQFSVMVMRQTYKAIEPYHDQPVTLVASPLSFGTRLAQEKWNLPTVTLQLAPAVFPSSIRPPRLPGLYMPPWYPMWLRHLMWRMVTAASNVLLPREMDAFCREVGVAPVRDAMVWWNSPLLTVGLFPEWFAMRPPDWPDYVRLTGFPLWDEKGVTPIPPNAQAFIDAAQEHGGPIVFTPGSAMAQGQAFFQQAVEACVRLKHPGLLLTRHPEQLPRHLPAHVQHHDYLPFSQILPQCSALVHHGGIGTTSQACAAGVPQLVMPLSHDQYDNVQRVRQLGLGDELLPKHFKADRLARKLSDMLGDRGIQERCRQIAEKLENNTAVADTCDLIEQL